MCTFIWLTDISIHIYYYYIIELKSSDIMYALVKNNSKLTSQFVRKNSVIAIAILL